MGCAFSAFASITALDYYVGAAFYNVGACCLGALIASAICSWTYLVFGDGRLSETAVYPLIFVYSFFFCQLNLPALGKKLGLSLLAINLIVGPSDPLPSSTTAWYLFIDVLFGCGCALIGTFFPYPRLASTALERRGRNSGAIMACLFHDTIVSWRYQRIERSNVRPAREGGMHREESFMRGSFSRGSFTRGGSFTSRGGSISARGSFLDPSLLSGSSKKENEGQGRSSALREQARAASVSGVEMRLAVEDENEDEEEESGAQKEKGKGQDKEKEQSDEEEDEEAVKTVLARSFPKCRNKRWRKLILVWNACRRARRPGTLPWQNSRSQTRTTREQMLACVEEDLDYMRLRAREAQYGPHRQRAVARYSDFVELVEQLLLVQRSMEARLEALESLLRRRLSTDIMRAFFSNPSMRRDMDLMGAAFDHCLASLVTWLQTDSSSRSNEALRQASEALGDAMLCFDATYRECRTRVYYEAGVPHLPEATLSMNCLLNCLNHSADLVLSFCQTHLSRAGTADSERIAYSPRSSSSSSSASASSSSSLSSRIKAKAASLLSAIFEPGAMTQGRFVESIILASSMTLGALYGLRSAREQPFLASFTISCLLGGMTGMKMAISISRVSGTAVACLFTLVIATFASGSEARSQRIVSSVACVCFLFPCTYIRTSAVIGYGGTVAGFSTALLLLAPLSTTLVLNRLIDTMFGVAIFLVFEVALAAHYTERTVLRDIIGSVEKLEQAAVATLQDFSSKRERSETVAGASHSVGGLQSFSSSLERLKLPSKETLVFSNLEPTFFTRQIFASSLLEGCIDDLVKCHQHLGYLSSVVEKVLSASAEFEIMPLQEHLERVDKHISSVVSEVLLCLQVGDFVPASRSEEGWRWMRWLIGESDVVSPADLRVMLEARRQGRADDEGMTQLDAQEDRIMRRFKDLVLGLQRGDDGTFGGMKAKGAKMSNSELVLVCSFLGGLNDFLRVLRVLTRRAAMLKDHYLVTQEVRRPI